MSEKSISDVLQDIKKLEERGTISHEEKDILWRRALQEGPSDDLIDDIEVYRNRQTTPADTKKTTAPQQQPTSQPPAIGIVAIALGGVSLFMPYIVNLALVPVALVCGLVAVGATKNGRAFVGTELNHKRLSVLIERVVALGLTYSLEPAA